MNHIWQQHTWCIQKIVLTGVFAKSLNCEFTNFIYLFFARKVLTYLHTYSPQQIRWPNKYIPSYFINLQKQILKCFVNYSVSQKPYAAFPALLYILLSAFFENFYNPATVQGKWQCKNVQKLFSKEIIIKTANFASNSLLHYRRSPLGGVELEISCVFWHARL